MSYSKATQYIFGLLDHRMGELQKLQKEILNRFYKEYGKRQIDKSSKGRKIDF